VYVIFFAVLITFAS